LAGLLAGWAVLGCTEADLANEGMREKGLLQVEDESPAAKDAAPLANESASSEKAPAAKEAPEIRGDGPTSTAVTVGWHNLGNSASGTKFPVRVTNTSSEVQMVELVLAGTTPSNQETIDQKLIDLVLAPKETRVVPVKIDELPVQSTVHPSGLRVVARYGLSSAALVSSTLMAFTEPLLITHDSTFKSATARKLGEQARVDALTPNRSTRLIDEGEVLMRNAKSGALARASEGNARVRHAPMMFHSQRPLNVDHENATHFPDTELPQGD
jgi:hypothetical protein